jgi:SAM-dependent methyltransferase
VTTTNLGRSIPRPTEQADWFEHWFGEEYLRLYPHRDESDAAGAIELVAAHVAGRRIDSVLDLACGAGRHSRLLCDRWWTVGLDLSSALLKVARRESSDAPYVRADMRELPFAAESFDLAVNLFTSFGYFDDDRAHAQVLKCVGAVTKIGGTFVLDFLNPEEVRRNLVAYDRHVVGGSTVEQIRSISADRKYVEKTIRVRDKEYLERVRLFSRLELEQMLEAAGFEVVRRAGDYAGAPWREDSPRTILFASRR